MNATSEDSRASETAMDATSEDSCATLATLSPRPFADRHIGPSDEQIHEMLDALGLDSLETLVDAALPADIRSPAPLDLPAGVGEAAMLAELREIAAANRVFKSFIGLGYYGTHLPPVIQRNVLENPAWYTAYTPYQPEISQGRLEALFVFQTLVSDLTGLPVANASLLDEATAAAEAMTLCRRVSKSESMRFFVSRDVFPQTIEVLRTRAAPLGYEIVIGDHARDLDGLDCFGALFQYPGANGDVHDYRDAIRRVHARGGLAVVAADLLALTLLTPPGELGADVAVGSTQRFGVPLGFGGPHAAYISTREDLTRQLPGRLVGLSIDRRGEPAYRLAIQTREQHIRREKATSNICTAQVLLAVIAAFYACYHGPRGLRRMAARVNRLTTALAAGLREMGIAVENATAFDTLTVAVDGGAERVHEAARERRMNLRAIDADRVGISLDETTTAADIEALWQAFAAASGAAASGAQNGATAGKTRNARAAAGGAGNERSPTGGAGNQAAEAGADRPAPLRVPAFADIEPRAPALLPTALARRSAFLTHPVFNRYDSETEMLRYIRRLADKDLALDRTMIPLGSCTMKLNAAAEMLPISWPGFNAIHPFAPSEQTEGYRRLIGDLERMLCACTGYAAVSLQPNAGSQGEYSALLAIRAYHASRGEGERDVCLIPSSAHGTNPASAQLAGLTVVVVTCDANGNVDVADLRAKAAQHASRLAAFMLTYPSTHGVFESAVRELCGIVHEAGGQVFIDGANLNAMVGLAKLAEIGGDASHLNLHKTFCIPHGGGGPGVGPVAVKAHLAPFLPGHAVTALPGGGAATGRPGSGAVSAAPYGSASILPISWSYIRLMGAEGLRKATQVAILNANYIARRLAPHYPVLYAGQNGLVAHECVLDLRPIKQRTGITVDDVAKRLIDFGFHAPTISFPVAGTLMIEPTESESLEELDRFCDAMIRVREEIEAVAAGALQPTDNPLVHAPHTARDLVDEWQRAYTREQAVFPLPALRHAKYWPPIARVDNVYGDRHLVCTCPPIEAYAAEDAFGGGAS